MVLDACIVCLADTDSIYLDFSPVSKLYSNLIIFDPRQEESWLNSHAVHELSCLGLIKIFWGLIKLSPATYLSTYLFFLHFQYPLCVFVCICRKICLTNCMKWGASEKWVHFHLRAHDWRPTLASLGVCCCWQESMAPCSLTESWHRFHSTVVYNSHAIALLHQQ